MSRKNQHTTSDVSDSELDSGTDLDKYSDGEYVPHKKTKRKRSPYRVVTRSQSKFTKRQTRQTRQTRRGRANNIRHKDDSDASDIELGSDSSDESDTPDTPDESKDEKTSTPIDVDSLLNMLVDSANSTNTWKTGLTQRDILKYEKHYTKIIDDITYCPKIYDVLKSNMTFVDKCNIVEKINIYNNIAPNTHEKAEIRKQIIKLFKTHTNVSLESEEKKLVSVQTESLKTQILSLPTSYKNKQLIYNKYIHLQSLNVMSSEYPKLKIWIQNALKMPYVINNPIKFDDDRNKLWSYLKNVRYVLDETIYGMDKVKTQIICILNSMITGNGKPTGIAMVGPQGVGKTELAHAISRATRLPFVSIPMGGASSGEVLTGISYSYEGSQPGEIFNSISQMKQLNGIIFMDEIDKISKTSHGEEISKLLLHITDTTQNHNFTDKYLGNQFQIDLSHILFVYSLNYAHLMNKTLKDRISIIQVDGYTNAEKTEIANKYIIPKLIKTLGISKYNITITDNAMQYIITETNKDYSFETMKDGKSGVRQLKHKLNTLFNKINLEITKNYDMDYKITKEIIDKFKIFKPKSITHLSMYS